MRLFFYRFTLFIFMVIDKQQCQKSYQTYQLCRKTCDTDRLLSYYHKCKANNKNNNHNQIFYRIAHIISLLNLSDHQASYLLSAVSVHRYTGSVPVT